MKHKCLSLSRKVGRNKLQIYTCTISVWFNTYFRIYYTSVFGNNMVRLWCYITTLLLVVGKLNIKHCYFIGQKIKHSNHN